MARIRSIKPEFWRNEDLSLVSAEAALLAIGLLNHADDDGYFNAHPDIIKADIFPLRELSSSTTVLLRELYDIGYVAVFYDPKNKSKSRLYGLIVNFARHQVINKKIPSKIKDLELLPYNYGSSTVALPLGNGKGMEREWKGNGRGMDGERECEGKPKSEKKTAKNGNGIGSAKADERAKPNGKKNSDECLEVFEYWQKIMGHPAAMLLARRRQLIADRLKAGYSVHSLKLAIDGHSRSDYHRQHKYDGIEYTLKETNIDKFIKFGEMTYDDYKRNNGSIDWNDTTWADGLS